MNLADHLRPLLRDHDCVIIPDFGGLVAEYTSAQVRPGGRHLLVPPTRQVAFNQALTRNDGLLVDTLRQHLGLAAAEAREAVRQAVAVLHHELQQQERTELPGIGVFRQLPDRGLQFDYTGTDNLLPATFGLPELAAHPVRVLDARLAREQQTQLLPRLRTAGGQLRWRRLVPGAAIGLLAGVAVAAFYLLSLHPEATPVAWRGYLPRYEAHTSPTAPQQAALAPVSLAAQPAPNQPVLAQPIASQPAPTQPALATAALAAKPEPAPTQTSPSQTVPGPMARVTPNAAEVLLDAPAGIRPGKAAKVPASGAVALANESNVARPVPLSKRRAAEPGLTTAYPVTPPTAKPVLGTTLLPTMAIRPGAAAAKPTAVVAKHVAPTAKPAVPATKPAAVAARPMTAAAKPVAAPAKPAASVAKPVAATAAPVAHAKPVVAAAAPALAAGVATTIKQRTGRFYIIVAAYTSLARAEVGRQNLSHAGRPAKVIAPPLGSRLYRLSAADFADRPTATLAAARLRQNPHFDKGLTILPY